jgi:hypothetical protein
MIKVDVLRIDYKPGLSFATLEQGYGHGARPKEKKILGGSNGTFITTSSDTLSKIYAVVLLEGKEIQIPIKDAIRQATEWQKITDKRIDRIQSNYPQRVSICQNMDSGYWYISDADMQAWGRTLQY